MFQRRREIPSLCQFLVGRASLLGVCRLTEKASHETRQCQYATTTLRSPHAARFWWTLDLSIQPPSQAVHFNFATFIASAFRKLSRSYITSNRLFVIIFSQMSVYLLYTAHARSHFHFASGFICLVSTCSHRRGLISTHHTHSLSHRSYLLCLIIPSSMSESLVFQSTQYHHILDITPLATNWLLNKLTRTQAKRKVAARPTAV